MASEMGGSERNLLPQLSGRMHLHLQKLIADTEPEVALTNRGISPSIRKAVIVG